MNTEPPAPEDDNGIEGLIIAAIIVAIVLVAILAYSK